ncbi:MAG: hypothetical protein LBS55_09565 [Prevotellaceae bacterium]|nr:hypothetical protein [Prevotellaceae bacterium]
MSFSVFSSCLSNCNFLANTSIERLTANGSGLGVIRAGKSARTFTFERQPA